MITSRHIISRLIVLGTALISSAHAENVAEPSASSLRSQKRPNILLMMCDDMEWRDLSAFQNERVPTPHIDRLALEATSPQGQTR